MTKFKSLKTGAVLSLKMTELKTCHPLLKLKILLEFQPISQLFVLVLPKELLKTESGLFMHMDVI